MLCNRFFCKRTSACAIDTNQLINIKREAAKLQTRLSVFNRENRIFCPRIGMEFLIGLELGERKTNTARVEEETITQAPDLLRVRVPASEDMVTIGAEIFFKDLLR